MHVKHKYINALIDAIDFITTNVDGADEGKREEEMLSILHEMVDKMKVSQHKALVNYYVRKKKVL